MKVGKHLVKRCTDKVNGMSVASEAFSSQLLRTESPKEFFGYVALQVFHFCSISIK